VARRYEISPNLVQQRWVKAYQEGQFEEVSATSSLAEVNKKARGGKRTTQETVRGKFRIAILRDLIKKKNPYLLRNWE
jgi:transposase